MSYQSIYEAWLADPRLAEADRAELAAIAGDEKEIKERFYMDLEFGTAGLRGIIGAGIIGESVLQQLLRIPDVEIVVVDYSQMRLDIAKQMGAHHICNPAKDGDALDYVINLWGNKEFLYNYGDRISGNADIVYECSGNAKAWGQAVQIAKPGGKVATVGTCEGMAQISPQWVQLKQVQLLGGLYGSIGQSIADINSGKLNVRPLATHVFPLEKLDEAFQIAMDSQRSLKVLIKVDESAPDYPYNKKD